MTRVSAGRINFRVGVVRMYYMGNDETIVQTLDSIFTLQTALHEYLHSVTFLYTGMQSKVDTTTVKYDFISTSKQMVAIKNLLYQRVTELIIQLDPIVKKQILPKYYLKFKHETISNFKKLVRNLRKITNLLMLSNYERSLLYKLIRDIELCNKKMLQEMRTASGEINNDPKTIKIFFCNK
jgi:hypothetical protein